MLDFEIHIGNNWQPSKNPTCNSNQPLLNAETRAIFCSHPMRGNNVGIVQKMSSKMTFCEISLHGRKVQSIVANEPGRFTEIIVLYLTFVKDANLHGAGCSKHD